MREDYFTNTPEDAGAYEARRGQADDVDDRPTLAELQRDEYDEPRACPDCEQKKHQNCTGEAWDTVKDEPTQCPCAASGHAS